MLIAGKVGQRGHHPGRRRAAGHAGHGAHIGPAAVAQALAGPQAVLGGGAVAVGQALLHGGDVAVRQHKVVGQHAAQVQQVGGDAVHLIDAQGLGRVPGHRAVDVVPQRGQRRQLHQRAAAWIAGVVQAGHAAAADVSRHCAAHQGRKHLVALAEHAVAGRASGLPHGHARGHRPGTPGQALEIRPHVDVPGGQLGRRGRTAYAGVAGGGCCWCCRCCGS